MKKISHHIEVTFGYNNLPSSSQNSINNGGPDVLGFDFYVNPKFKSSIYVKYIKSILTENNCNKEYRINVRQNHKVVKAFWKKENIKQCIEENKWIYQ